MNITAFDIYLFGLLGNIQRLTGLFEVAAIASVLVFGYLLIVADTKSDDTIRVLKVLKRTFFTAITGLLLLMLTPTQATYAAMVIAPKLQQSAILKRDFPALYEAARSYLLNSLTIKTKKDSNNEE